MSPLIAASELLADLASDAPPLVLDVRWSLGAADPRGDHEAAHIPGSLYVDLDTELAGPGEATAGRHPLPEPDAFAATATRWGVGPDTAVVVYDDVGGLSRGTPVVAAALDRPPCGPRPRRRARRLAGVAGGAVETGPDEPPVAASTPLVARLGSMPTVTADDIAAGRAGMLVDARAAERFRGEVEPIDPRRRPHPRRRQRADCRQPHGRAHVPRRPTPCTSGSPPPA